jgi:broad specificity phosphatase PhoE
MVRIVLIRPGTTQFDEQRRIQGTLDIPLSERGVAQVATLVGELAAVPIEAVYCSPCLSARQTAAAVAAAHDVRLKELDKLHNVNLGLWQGRCLDEVQKTQPKVFRQWQERPDSVCPPGGETLFAVRQRIDAALAKLLKKHPAGAIALVLPEPLARLVHCHLAGGEPVDLWNPTTAAGWEVLTVEPQRLVAST